MRTLVVNALRLVGCRTAIGRHLEYLARYWSSTPIPFDKVVWMAPTEMQLERLGSTTPMEMRTFASSYPNLVWEQCALPLAARKAAVLFSEYTCPLFYPGRVVVANHGIYDAVPDAFSRWQHFRGSSMNRSSAWRADRIIANSSSTQNDLVRCFGTNRSKIEVVYPGPADEFFIQHAKETITHRIQAIFTDRVPYVIFVGKLSKRRNVPNLIEAFSIVRESLKLPHRLLIVGPNVNNLPIHELAVHHGILPFLKYCPHLEQDDLAKLYAGADLFVLPTTYEGISWTMFEAMASGTAVLTVDHPTLAEGPGDSVLSMPTPSVSDLVRGMTMLLTDAALRHQFESKGRTVAQQFSLRESARRTMEVLDKVALPSDKK